MDWMALLAFAKEIFAMFQECNATRGPVYSLAEVNVASGGKEPELSLSSSDMDVCLARRKAMDDTFQRRMAGFKLMRKQGWGPFVAMRKNRQAQEYLDAVIECCSDFEKDVYCMTGELPASALTLAGGE